LSSSPFQRKLFPKVLSFRFTVLISLKVNCVSESSFANRNSYTSFEPHLSQVRGFILQTWQASDSRPIRKQRSSFPFFRPITRPTASIHVSPQLAHANLFLVNSSIESLLVSSWSISESCILSLRFPIYPINAYKFCLICRILR